MRKSLTTVALLLALSCTAFGGEMSAPPAPASTQTQAASPTLIETVLTLLASVLP